MRTLRALLPALLGVGLLLFGLGCGGERKRPLQGAGSTFVDPIMQEWAVIYKKEKSTAVNYQAKGSGAGIAMMTKKEVDFGCSDAPLNEEQLAEAKEKGGEVIHIPLCMGAIVPAYNLPDLPDLVFSGKVLMHIYLGKITSWDDPALVKLNPGKTLPAQKISVAYRSDGSGSTYILTDYFMKIDEEAWTPKRGTSIKFPVGTGSKGTDGVAGFVKQTKGAIGYVELIYALKNDIPYGSVINAAEKPIKATMKSVTAAAATAEIPDDLRYSITNAPGKDAYPIAGTVWAIVYTKQPARKVEPLRDFLTWVVHDGQSYTEKLHYAPLPEALVKRIDDKLKKIEASK
jgi:phosphate transport system substrate-binding protein